MKLTKKKIVLLLLFALILLNVCVGFINKQIMKSNDKKVKKELNSLIEEKIDYVFVEINPKFALKTKNNKIEDVGCLNDDCVSIYNELEVIGKGIEDGIDYIYNFVKNTGRFAIDKVVVKTNKDITFDDKKDYVQVENISVNEVKEMLDGVINNENVKDDKPIEDYNTKLLNELKNDKDYGKIYECSLIDNEVKCYIKEDLLVGFTVDSADITKYLTKYDDIIPNINGINRVLNKFGMETKGERELGIFYNPTYYAYNNGLEFVAFVDGETYLSKYVYYKTRINCSIYRFDLTKINLLDLDNLNKYIDVIEDQPSEEISEEELGHCGKKLCTWKVTVNKVKYVCDVASQTMNFSHTEEVDVLYKVCDANDENCKNVSKDEYQYYSPDTGYLFDLKICDGSEKSGDACRSFIDGKWDAIIFQN